MHCLGTERTGGGDIWPLGNSFLISFLFSSCCVKLWAQLVPFGERDLVVFAISFVLCGCKLN